MTSQKHRPIKLTLQDGSLNTDEAIKKIKAIFGFSNEALYYLKSEFKTDKALREFSWFYSLHHKLILKYNSVEKIEFSKQESARYEKIINIIFNDENWIEEHFIYPDDLRSEIVFLLFYLTPDIFLSKLKLSLKNIEILNIGIANSWIWGRCYVFEARLQKMLTKKVARKMSHMFISILISSFELSDYLQVKKFTKKKKRLINIDELDELFNLEMSFWELMTVRANFSISPNRIYTDEMFKMTSEYIVKGYREYVAFDLTLEHFEFNPIEKRDSYRKAYKIHLKKK